MKLWIYTGRPSEGAALLAQEDGFYRMRTGRDYKPGDVVVNWGNGGDYPPKGNVILNKPGAVLNAVNKLRTFQILSASGVFVVPWTILKLEAEIWLNEGYVVVARKILTGHEGAGIVIVEKVNELIQAPLYTKYINKVREFRVHATPYGVIDTQQKVHNPALGQPKSWKVRSYGNGFIFQRKGILPNQNRDQLAIAAVKALGLDFGGLDIIEDKQGNFYVLEVNTAPGIEGTTVKCYAEAIRELGTNAVAINRGQKPTLVLGGIGKGVEVAEAAPVAKPNDDFNHVKLGKPLGIRNLNLGW